LRFRVLNWALSVIPLSVFAGSLYQPPAQRAVPIVLADGVLLVEGSVAAPDRSGLFVLDSSATRTIVHGKSGIGSPLENEMLRIAGAEIGPLRADVSPLRNCSRVLGQPVTGIAGGAVLQRLAARIDYANHLLTLVVPASCQLPAGRVKLKIVGGLPFAEATMRTASGKAIGGYFLIDTGQSGTGLILTHEFAAAHPELNGTATLPSLDTDGVVRQTQFLRLDSLTLGGHALRGPIAGIAPPSSDGAPAQLAGSIGGSILEHFDVLLDEPQSAMTLKPNANFAAPFEVDMSGLLPIADSPVADDVARSGQRAYTIAAIAEKSPAADAGLRVGDRLLTIANRKVDDMTLDQVRDILKAKPGAKVLLTLERGGDGAHKTLAVTLMLRRAL